MNAHPKYKLMVLLVNTMNEDSDVDDGEDQVNERLDRIVNFLATYLP